MHIIYVTSEFVTEENGGGLASYLVNIARIFRDHGHEVTIVTLSDQNDDGIEWENGIRVERVRKEHRKLVVPLVRILDSRHLNNRVKSVLKQHPADVIQYASFLAVGFCHVKSVPACVRISSDPVAWRVLKYIDQDPRKLPSPCLTDRIEYAAEKNIGNIVGPSRACGEIIEGHTGRAVRVIESPFYLQEESYDRSLYDNRLAGKKYYLSHSSQSCIKGTHVIAKAIPAIAKSDPDAYFAFAGTDHGIFYRDGRNVSAQDYILEQAGEYRDRVIFLGTVPRNQLYPVIEGAYACLMPSRLDNMPNTCIEAMAMGKIVIGTRGASYGQLIEDGVSGYLIDIDDAAGLAAACQKINALTEVQRRQMGTRAAETAERFAPEKIYDQMIAYYQELIAESGRRFFQEI